MKKIEILAIIVIVLTVVSVVGQHCLGEFSQYLEDKHGLSYAKISMYRVYARSLPQLLVQIGIAVWMYLVSRRANNTPLVWALFGLVYGLLAPILFYAVRIYEKLSQNKAL